MNLRELSQQRNSGQLHDSQYMPASEKARVLKQWEWFLKSGCAKEKFTKKLYNHLHLHCSFIAHYDIHGFYSTYFEHGDDTIRFLKQFDNSNGMPRSAELGMHSWLTDQEYYDINIEMCRIAGKYMEVLLKQAQAKQRRHDIEMAQLLLAKHGVYLDQDELREQLAR